MTAYVPRGFVVKARGAMLISGYIRWGLGSKSYGKDIGVIIINYSITHDKSGGRGRRRR